MKNTATRAAAVLALFAAASGCEKADKGTPVATRPAALTVSYNDGFVEWVSRHDLPHDVYTMKGKMDVTFGEQYVTVRTDKGTTVFLREYLTQAGPRE